MSGAVRADGLRFRDGLLDHEAIDQVRGRGLMVGIGLAKGVDSRDVARVALVDGLVVNTPNPQTIRLLLPLTIGERDLTVGLERLRGASDSVAAWCWQ